MPDFAQVPCNKPAFRSVSMPGSNQPQCERAISQMPDRSLSGVAVQLFKAELEGLLAFDVPVCRAQL